MNIYELYGRQTEKLEQAMGQLMKTLGLLKAIQDGKIDIKDVEVSPNGWQIKPSKEDG